MLEKIGFSLSTASRSGTCRSGFVHLSVCSVANDGEDVKYL